MACYCQMNDDAYISWDFAPGKKLSAIQSKSNGKKVANDA